MDNGNKNLRNLSASVSLFDPDETNGKGNKNLDMVSELLNKYFIRDMNEWENVNACLENYTTLCCTESLLSRYKDLERFTHEPFSQIQFTK